MTSPRSDATVARRLACATVTLLAALAVLLCAPPAIAAPDSVLGFEEFAEGQLLGEHAGVEFGSKSQLGFVAQPGVYDGIFSSPARPFVSCDRRLVVRSPGLRGNRRLQPQCINFEGGSVADSGQPALFAGFAVSRRRVSLRYRAAPCVDTPPSGPFAGLPCESRVALVAFAADGRRIAVDVAGVRGETLSVSSSQNDIAFIEVGHDGRQNKPGDLIGIDELSFDNPDPGDVPAADFFFDNATVSKPAGGTFDIPLRLRRINFSSGQISLSHGPVASGVEAVDFVPNPTSGDVVIAKVKLSPTAVGRTMTIPVTATPLSVRAGPQARTATITIAVRDPYQIAGAFPMQVDPCASATRTLTVVPDREYQGAPVAVNLTVPAPFRVSPATFVASAAGNTAQEITVMAPAGSSSAEAKTVEVTTSAPGFPTITHRMQLVVRAARIARVVFDGPPTNGFLRERPGTVTVIGSGLCPGSTVSLGEPAQKTAVPASSDQGGTRLTAAIAPVAAPGTVSVTTPDGSATVTDNRLRTYRAIWGFAFRNFAGVEATTNDVLSGFRDSHVSVDVCGALSFGAFDCEIRVPHPWAAAFIRKDLEGLCFGFTTVSGKSAIGLPVAGMSRRDRLYDIAPAAGAPGWLTDAIRRQHLMQWSGEAAVSRRTAGSSDIGPRVAQMLAQGEAPVMSMRIYDSGKERGHAVLAYRVRPRPGGGSLIDVYDPNRPYSQGEDAGEALNVSTIATSVNGSWSFSGLSWNDAKLNGAPWGGDGSRIATIPLKAIPKWGDGTILTNIAVPFIEDATVNDERGRPARDVPGAEPLPSLDASGGPVLYRLTPDRTWALSGGAAFVGDGWSASATSTGGRAATRRASTKIDPRARSIGMAGARAVLTVSVDHGGGSRTATLEAPAGARMGFTRNENELVLRGRGSATLTFGAARKQRAPTAARLKLKLAAGTTVIGPASWTKSGPVRVAVRRRGARRTIVARKVALRVQLRAPKVKITGGNATVSVNVAGVRAGDAKIAIRARALRGRRTVGRPAAKLVQRNGGAVRLVLARVPRGALTVEITATAVGTLKGQPVSGTAQLRTKARKGR